MGQTCHPYPVDLLQVHQGGCSPSLPNCGRREQEAGAKRTQEWGYMQLGNDRNKSCLFKLLPHTTHISPATGHPPDAQTNPSQREPLASLPSPRGRLLLSPYRTLSASQAKDLGGNLQVVPNSPFPYIPHLIHRQSPFATPLKSIPKTDASPLAHLCYSNSS